MRRPFDLHPGRDHQSRSRRLAAVKVMLACGYLRLAGYRVLGAHAHTGAGLIDLDRRPGWLTVWTEGPASGRRRRANGYAYGSFWDIPIRWPLADTRPSHQHRIAHHV